ncbi:MAG: hypothetical protein KY455_02835 [Euryarchaeota archaeon]|nr:hypothetical protein [Euryarchaeota archaeon]
MAKRVRTTGVPIDQAQDGAILPRLRRYTGHQCPGCPLHGTCDPDPPPQGPWQVLSAEAEKAVECRVHPTVRMVPITVRRIKEDHAPPPAPVHARREETNVLLDANALIEGAKGTFKGIINLILEPPPGFRYFTTDIVEKEVRFLRNVDRNIVFDHITVVSAPPRIDPIIQETHGSGITPPTDADAGLFQLAKDDPRYHVLVSHDRFHRWSGLARTLGIADRLTVYGVDSFIKYAKKKRV